jgi:hypothetical protein
VTITIHEVHDYVPAASPTFATRVARAFQNSVDGLVRFAENLILTVVAFLPWLPLWALGLALLWWLVRRVRARRRARMFAAT